MKRLKCDLSAKYDSMSLLDYATDCQALHVGVGVKNHNCNFVSINNLIVCI